MEKGAQLGQNMKRSQDDDGYFKEETITRMVLRGIQEEGHDARS